MEALKFVLNLFPVVSMLLFYAFNFNLGFMRLRLKLSEDGLFPASEKNMFSYAMCLVYHHVFILWPTVLSDGYGGVEKNRTKTVLMTGKL